MWISFLMFDTLYLRNNLMNISTHNLLSNRRLTYTILQKGR